MTFEQLVLGYDKVFLKEARRAARQAREAFETGDHDLHAGAAFTAVTAACSAVEAFVSERTAYYAYEDRIEEGILRKLRTDRVTISLQLNRLVRAFNGKGVNEHEAYAPFRALVELRHCFVHRKANYLPTTDWPENIKEEHRCHIPALAEDGLDWTSRVLHHETAQWAVEVTGGLLTEANRHVPQPPRREMRRFLVRANTDRLQLTEYPARVDVGPRDGEPCRLADELRKVGE